MVECHSCCWWKPLGVTLCQRLRIRRTENLRLIETKHSVVSTLSESRPSRRNGSALFTSSGEAREDPFRGRVRTHLFQGDSSDGHTGLLTNRPLSKNRLGRQVCQDSV